MLRWEGREKHVVTIKTFPKCSKSLFETKFIQFEKVGTGANYVRELSSGARMMHVLWNMGSNKMGGASITEQLLKIDKRQGNIRMCTKLTHHVPSHSHHLAKADYAQKVGRHLQFRRIIAHADNDALVVTPCRLEGRSRSLALTRCLERVR